MILTLYNYNFKIPVTMSRYSGQLGNVTMFDDTLVLHKNMNNIFQLTITDRDRVKLKLDEESPLKVKFRIISENEVVVSSFYLDYKNDGNFWEFVIPKEEVNKLEADAGYRFAATLYQEDAQGNNEEVPLYVDHNFKLMGYLEVNDNYFDIIEYTYTTTEPVVDHYLTDEKEFEAKHFFIDTLFNDDNVYKVEVKYVMPEQEFDEFGEPLPIPTDRCYVTLERNTQTHYPIEPNNDQWEPVATYYGIGIEDTEIEFNKIPLKTYGRVIIHTDRPDNFELIVHKIDR